MSQENRAVRNQSTTRIPNEIKASDALIEAIDSLTPVQAFNKQLRLHNDAFNERIKAIMNGDPSDKEPLIIGNPSQCLLECGFPCLPIEISVSKLREKMNQPNHQFSILSIVHMPDCICKPIAVFQSVGTTTDKIVKVVLTEMVDSSGVNLVVAIELNKKLGSRTVNSIRSLYPKDSTGGIIKWIVEDNLMEYCNKQKALDWIGKQRSNPVEVTKRIEDFTNVNIFLRNP